MTGLVLDRMVIEEAGASPIRLAEAIHEQLGQRSGPIPIEAIARALDITSIVYEPLTNFEGALVTTPERGIGQILVNADRRPRRRRFTIAHELGHFLNLWHAPTSVTGFRCDREDLRASLRGKDDRSRDRHRQQEAEANTFAIELLAPRRSLRQYLAGKPDLAQALTLSNAFDISREAGARRYVECHRETLAVVFSQNGRVEYYDSGNAFPRLTLNRRTPLPTLPEPRMGKSLSDIEEVDAAEWLFDPGRHTLTAQTLQQQDNCATILLHAEEVEEDDGIEDTVSRFSRFAR